MVERVVVVGASGFGRETLDVLYAMQFAGSDIEVAGVVDDAPSEENLQRLTTSGTRHLGTIDTWLTEGPHDVKYLLAIGSPTIRRRLVERVESKGLIAYRAIHPSAVLGSGVKLRDGVVICAGAVISTNVQVGQHVHINPNATIGHDAVLQDFVSINPAAVISGEVRVGPGTLVGAAATILQTLTVGSDSILGAGSVLTKDVPSGTIAKGVPAVWAK